MKDGEGNLTYPFGPDAVGHYMFTNSGYGGVAIMKKDRPNFTAGDIFAGSSDEFTDASKGYIPYGPTLASGNLQTAQRVWIADPTCRTFSR